MLIFSSTARLAPHNKPPAAGARRAEGCCWGELWHSPARTALSSVRLQLGWVRGGRGAQYKLCNGGFYVHGLNMITSRIMALDQANQIHTSVDGDLGLGATCSCWPRIESEEARHVDQTKHTAIGCRDIGHFYSDDSIHKGGERTRLFIANPRS